MLITPAYIAANRVLHETNPHYGTSGARSASAVLGIARQAGIKTILDYGCGKGGLKPLLTDFDVREYDPAIPGKDTPPERADMVVCTDVLEHIEPDCLDTVLDDLRRLTLDVAFLTVATAPAKKMLPDGRNAHLIQKPAKWWLPRLMERWELAQFNGGKGGFVVVLT